MYGGLSRARHDRDHTAPCGGAQTVRLGSVRQDARHRAFGAALRDASFYSRPVALETESAITGKGGTQLAAARGRCSLGEQQRSAYCSSRLGRVYGLRANKIKVSWVP